jgi:DNA polymerase III subunit beta
MLITAPARDLARAASAAAASSNDRSNIPILGNLLLTANGAVQFTGSNLEGWMTATVAAEITTPGNVAVDGRIAKLLAGLPPDGMAKITMANGVVTLTCGRSRYRVDNLPLEDFPPALVVGDATELTLSDTDRLRLFATPAFAISDEEARYYLCGLSLKLVDGRLVACATTGHQLIKTSVEAPPGCVLPQDGVIIPGKACTAIAKLDGCSLQINDKCIEAFTDTVHFSHKLIAATFPAYERAIPAPSGNSVEVDRLELIAALKRLLCVATQEKSVVKLAALEWADDEMSLSLARQPDAAADVLPAITTGSGKTGLAVGMFIDLLGAISAERIMLDASDPGSAVRITLPGDDDFLAIQMPCRM